MSKLFIDVMKGPEPVKPGRQKWIYDRVAREVVTAEEYSRREAERKPKFLPPISNAWKPKERGTWRYDKSTRKLVKVAQRPRLVQVAPTIRTDDMAPVESMATADREVFTSRSAYERHLKEHGYHVREKGEEIGTKSAPTRRKPDPKQIREDVAKALNDLRWGNVPVSEKEKALCQLENQKMQEWKRRQGLR